MGRFAAMLLPVALDPAALPVPLLGRLLPAGFPSPADDHLDGEIDLSRHLIERPAATFLMRVSGESMRGAGILDGDMVVVDRSLGPKPGDVVVAVCQGEMTLKRLCESAPKRDPPEIPAQPFENTRKFDAWVGPDRRRSGPTCSPKMTCKLSSSLAIQAAWQSA